MVNAEIGKNTLIELETDFSWVTVFHPLNLGVVDVLTRILIFEFKSENGNTVEDEHHINGFLILCGIMPLTHAVDGVFGIEGGGGLIESRFGLEIADTEGYAPVFEAVAKDIEKSVRIASVVECEAEFAHGVNGILINKPCPFFGLGFLNEFDEGINI